MTSELKPYAYAYIGKDGQLDGDRFGTHPLTEGDLKAGYSQIPLYPRAVPDVPGLVRYDLACDFDGKHHPDIIEVELGDFVRYDQAAAIIADNDAYTHELSRQLRSLEETLVTQKEIIDNLMGKGK